MAHRSVTDVAPKTVTVTSPAFSDGSAIPREFTCRGEDASPPLAIGSLPPATRALALVMDDPDAPRGTFTHGTAWAVPPAAAALPRGADVRSLGGVEGVTDFGRTG